MTSEKRFRGITLLYMAILLMNFIILAKGQNNLRKADSDNYIVIYFDTEYTYEKFDLGNRNLVSYVKYGNTEVHRNADNEFPIFTVNSGNPEITARIPLEIHFSSCVSSLDKFFDCEKKVSSHKSYPDYDHFVEVDFSHFDSSCLESIEALFSNCRKIEKINFSNFNTKKIKDMTDMLSSNYALKSLDLSSFDTSNVVKMIRMFSYNTLEVLDLTGFNFENIKNDSQILYIFYTCHIDFLNLKDTKNPEVLLEELKRLHNTYLCLNDANMMRQIIDYQYRYLFEYSYSFTICCEFDKDTKKCDSSNYFSLYYGNSVSYMRDFVDYYRREVAFLTYDNTKKSMLDIITIQSNQKLDVKFAYPIDNLNYFFHFDENKNNVVSLDFSNFDSSKVTSMEDIFDGLTSLKYIDLSGFGSSLTSMKGLFKGLNSLESINLSNIKTSKVTSIESMFENCTSLTSIDISMLDTTSLKNMNTLFYGCSTLKVIDFSNLNLENINSANNMFYGLNTNFEYIILTNVKLSDVLFSKIKADINDKYYYLDCSTTEIMQNGDYKCCNTNGERNCFQCLDSKIIFYDKISFLSSKEQISCGNIDISKYYLKEEGTKKYYRKCENAMANCDECSSEDHCSKCKTNYAFRRGSIIECVLKTSIENDKHFYTDDSGITYHSCSLYNTISNCDECSSSNTCDKCKTNYVLKHENNYECVLKTSLENDKHFYTDDSGITYHSCNLYHAISNCDECSSGNTCDKCIENYVLKHGNNYVCILKTSIQNDKHFYTDDSGKTYHSCSLYNTISNCDECSNKNTCDKCKTYYVIKRDNNYECISKTSIENDKHFYSDDSGITYYSCSLYNDVTNCDECSSGNTCDKCKTNYAIKRDNNYECVLKTSLENDKHFYTDDSGITYHSCNLYNTIYNCDECSSGNTCEKCIEGYVLKHGNNYECVLKTSLENDKHFYTDDSGKTYHSCSLYNTISNCDECSNKNTCDKCIEGYVIKRDNNYECISKTLIENDKHFYSDDSGITYYSCSLYNTISNCDECSSGNTCDKCIEGYVIKHGNNYECVLKTSLENDKHFYTDDSGITYHSCNLYHAISNCDECSSGNTCDKCIEGYVLKRDNNYECISKTSIENDKHFYSDDSGITYYSCSLYNDVTNCDECSNKNTCDKCLEGYKLLNNNTLCAKQEDIDNKLYVKDNNDLYIPCSNLIKDCYQCNTLDACSQCQDGAGLTEDDACVKEEEVEEKHDYYKDEISNKYISCSIMAHCLTCNSSSVCTSCETGFILDSNKCKESEEKEKDSGLSKGAIVGISFGTIFFLLILIFIAYFVYKKIFKKINMNYQQTYDVEQFKEQTERNKEKENEQNVGKQSSEDPVVYKRRSVSNSKQ